MDEDKTVDTTETVETPETTTTTGEMVPASRLRGIIKEQKKAEQEAATLRAKLDALEADKLSDIEKANRAAEKAIEDAGTKTAETEALRKQLAAATTAAYLKTAHNPDEAAGMVPADIIEIEDGRLTAASKKAIDAWGKSRPYLFDTGKKGGNIPGPGDTTPKDAAKRYQECIDKGDMSGAEAAFAAMNKTP